MLKIKQKHSEFYIKTHGILFGYTLAFNFDSFILGFLLKPSLVVTSKTKLYLVSI